MLRKYRTVTTNLRRFCATTRLKIWAKHRSSGVVPRQSYEILSIVASTRRREAKLNVHLFCSCDYRSINLLVVDTRRFFFSRTILRLFYDCFTTVAGKSWDSSKLVSRVLYFVRGSQKIASRALVLPHTIPDNRRWSYVYRTTDLRHSHDTATKNIVWVYATKFRTISCVRGL